MKYRFPFHVLGPLTAVLCICGTSFAGGITVEIGKTRAPEIWGQKTDTAVRDYAKRTTAISTGLRTSLIRVGMFKTKLFLPVRVVLTDGGRPLAAQTKAPGDIVPTFDSTGARVFPSDYKTYLEQVFTAAKPVMDAVFGTPSSGGVVHIRNYDGDLQDRYAVAGGYFVPNGTNGPEVRFPVYNNRVAAAVNYIHTLMLAYLGTKQYPFDAYDEGLVRAATILVCRTPGSIPNNPTSDEIEAVLTGLYDVGSVYDWFNHVGLGAPKFIAPNLLDAGLPFGGSTGGIFLLRYQMAGTAWAKVAIRYPGFISEFNKRYYANPGAYTNSAQLESLGQQVLDFLAGASNTKIEGWSFSDWAIRQAVLDTRLSPGIKVIATPVAIPALPGSSDFGAFDIVVNVFQTQMNGDEILLSGTSYPLYWRPDFSRFFTLPQDDVIKIAGAYGSVTPNFPSDTFANKPYRVTVDVPYDGKTARVHLPAGAVSTGGEPDFKSLYGTIEGLPAPGATPYTLTVSWTGGKKTGIAVANNAFGYNITDQNYLRSGRVTVQVLQGSTVKITREVIKTEGSLALDLFPPESEVNYTFTRPGRLEFMGLPLEPYRPNPADILGLPDNQTLFARWESTVGHYFLYPDEGEFRMGLGYWLRPPSAQTRTVQGRQIPGMPIAVALNPGWNQVTLPFNTPITTANILVTAASEAVGTYDQAVTDGTLGNTIFQFVADGQNADAGTMSPVLSLLPGKAYLIRANRPEGAVLLFVPPGGSRAPSGGGSGRIAPHYTMVWETKVTLSDSTGKSCSVSVGQAAGARRLYDVSLDTDLPPQYPGFQMLVLNGMSMIRDIRPAGTYENYRFRLKGLVRGRRYSLRFAPSGASNIMILTDGSTKIGITSNQTYNFTATGSERIMTFETRGGH